MHGFINSKLSRETAPAKEPVVGNFNNEAFVVREIDVLNYVTKSSTPKQRKKLAIGPIFINAAVCKKCKDYIRSKHKHDFKWCSCKAIAVDGGSWYARRLGNPENIIDIIENFHG